MTRILSSFAMALFLVAFTLLGVIAPGQPPAVQLDLMSYALALVFGGGVIAIILFIKEGAL